MPRMIDAEALYEAVSDHVTTVSVCPTADWARGKAAMKEICLEDIKNAPTVGGWISVKDRLPDEKENWITKDYQKVICCCDFGGKPQRIDVRTYGFGNGHFWHGHQIMDGVITHWMPLPEPPKEDEDDAEQ